MNGAKNTHGRGVSCSPDPAAHIHRALEQILELTALIELMKESVCRRQALRSSVTRRFRRRARIEMKAIEMNAMRWSFERSKIVFNRR